ncbi:MAG: carboxylating nicotinate-nucleotide diphosphorylase [Dehalococcoidales bacterium]|nr:carboxylating nicotinate-nucleotide diphosphorylase [Dehalococcoidales bacterium]
MEELYKTLDNIIDLALAEDVSQGDITSQLLIPPGLEGKASILVKAEGVLAGGEVVKKVFLRIDSSLKVELLVKDGTKIQSGDTIAIISGRVTSILKAERIALNFLQRLSGIASSTAQYVAAAEGFKAKITDTRKTTPGLRQLEKYAVRVGGGNNHRFHLGDGILIKDNHLTVLYSLGMSLKDIVIKAKQQAPQGMTVEVEVTTVEEAAVVAQGGVDVILLDNMSVDEMRRAVKLIPSYIKTEASGGITLNNVRDVAQTEVDIISVGALTHSPRALDISLEFEPETFRLD